jgi:prepilin-type N-terminal cleavage/methylation domain-containing protein
MNTYGMRVNGFTLVEMMVAVLLLSMISVIGYQGIVFAAKQWGGGEEKLALAFNKHQSLTMLRKKLSAVERVSYSRNGKNVFSFEGLHDSLKFVSKFENAKQGGLYVCELSTLQTKGNVIFSYGLLHPENGGFSKPNNIQHTDVLSGIKKVNFWYFGSQRGERSKWYKRWNAESILPKLIKFRLMDKTGLYTESVIYIETSDV